jgi:hypothetical protein
MPRTRSIAVWLLAGAISLAGLLCALDLAHQKQSKPYYQGKPLEYWFNQLPMTNIRGVGSNATVVQFSTLVSISASRAVKTYGGFLERPEASATAIRAMGTNALEFYLSKLTRHYGSIKSRVDRAARIVGFKGFLFESISPEREQAVTALILLKPLPPNVVSKLTLLSTNSNREISVAARCALTTKVDELVLLRSPDN